MLYSQEPDGFREYKTSNDVYNLIITSFVVFVKKKIKNMVKFFKKGFLKMYNRIRDLREDSDKTQADMAQILNMWLTTYRNYETGTREPPFEFMIKLAQHYNVSLDYLAGLIDTPEELHRFKKKEDKK